MRLRRLAFALLPIAFTACLSGTDYGTNTYPLVPIEQTTFATSLNVDLSKSTKTATGLYYRDLVTGTGATATSTSRVSTYYALYFPTGQKIEELSSPSTPYSFTIGTNPPAVIAGWDEGVQGMKVGGTRQLIVPPSLAYGTNGAGVIPPNSVLVFTIQLVAVQ
ncbi:MAG: peptidylprolyl isomerase [Gemmatimonadetes bacterium]|nr:MAG: peptidylprolyl isomerase [Gemmatimonadota bacterium]